MLTLEKLTSYLHKTSTGRKLITELEAAQEEEARVARDARLTQARELERIETEIGAENRRHSALVQRADDEVMAARERLEAAQRAYSVAYDARSTAIETLTRARDQRRRALERSAPACVITALQELRQLHASLQELRPEARTQRLPSADGSPVRLLRVSNQEPIARRLLLVADAIEAATRLLVAPEPDPEAAVEALWASVGGRDLQTPLEPVDPPAPGGRSWLAAERR